MIAHTIIFCSVPEALSLPFFLQNKQWEGGAEQFLNLVFTYLYTAGSPSDHLRP
jgi:hypothetical protein